MSQSDGNDDGCVLDLHAKQSIGSRVMDEYARHGQQGDDNDTIMGTRVRLDTDPLCIVDIFWVTIEGPIGAGKTELCNVLLPRLRETFGENRVFFVPENIDETMQSGLFQDFQRDPKRYAYQFQTVLFRTRTDDFLANWTRMLDVVGETPDPIHDAFHHTETIEAEGWRHRRRVILVTERSILSDAIFMQIQNTLGNATDRELNDYMKLNAAWRLLYPAKPNLVIYCRAGSTVEGIVSLCDKRIKERRREAEEVLVTPEYNRVLLEEHERVFNNPAMGSTARFHMGNQLRPFSVKVVLFDTTENYRDNKDVALKKSSEIISHICAHSNTPSTTKETDGDDNPYMEIVDRHIERRLGQSLEDAKKEWETETKQEKEKESDESDDDDDDDNHYAGFPAEFSNGMFDKMMRQMHEERERVWALQRALQIAREMGLREKDANNKK